jgi:ABC-type dipeptide/oligopeptide/nickel transport system permease subunit
MENTTGQAAVGVGVGIRGNPIAARLERNAKDTLRMVWKFARLKPLGAVGAVIVIFIFALAAFPNIIATHDPLRIVDLNYLGASSEHYFGTDTIGRDQFSRTVWAARTTVQISMTAVVVGVTLALIIGVVTTYAGGLVDLLFQRVNDTLQSMPGLIMALFILTIMGPSKPTIIGTIIVLGLPRNIRVIRSAVLSVKEMPYVESAQAIGASVFRVWFKYIIPQVTALYFILISLSVGFAILLESSLAFLGLGLSVEEPSWGNMVNRGIQDIFFATWTLAIPPAVLIALSVVGFNLFGDSLRDVLDPRLRGSGVGLRRGST